MIHTPGPWRYEMHGDTNYATLFMTNSVLTGDVMRGYIGEDNARLIAAAPDLLAACQAFAEYARISGNGAGIAEMAAAAIEKATGDRRQ
ncbi:MAG: hypothetical protein EOM21_18805 [Gammaproteobacteria bacterium]|nr:hypothetical protein [Gammaproteobacteria bacterium]